MKEANNKITLKTKIILKFCGIVLPLACCFLIAIASCQENKPSNDPPDSTSLHLRRSPVGFHISFNSKKFLRYDIIAQSDRSSIKRREISFPQGKFGRGIRMNFTRPPVNLTNMSGTDLDWVTAVLFNTNYHPGNKLGYNAPFIWGSGRINLRLGAVAFWAKGKLAPTDSVLFKQTAISFGRKERDLLAVTVNKDKKLGAYVRDARYVYHKVKSNIKWDPSRWNSIVLNWDWANGLQLWLNGKEIASSWDKDAWFATAPPGLFSLPSTKITYDELWLMDRPLTKPEIEQLMVSNTPPSKENPVFVHGKRNLKQLEHSKRLKRISGADKSGHVPKVSPNKALSLTEVWPDSVADGRVPGWNVIDGRNEMAWPLPMGFFTIIPGDADFHAKKVDISTSPHSKVNYIVLTGNLTDIEVQKGGPKMNNPVTIFQVPSGRRFFYGSMIATTQGATFRIPFTENFGAPPGYHGKPLQLPLSGKKRIQNVGLYYVKKTPSKKYNPEGKKFTLSNTTLHLSGRMQFAINAVTSRDERKFAIALEDPAKGNPKVVDIGAFGRLNILSKPYNDETAVSGVTLSLPVKTSEPEATLFVRVRDPAVPTRLWNQFAIRLKGFNRGYKRLTFTINFQDIMLTGGDRLWIDLGTAGKTEIKIGNSKNPANLFVSTVAPYRAVDQYAQKELMPAKSSYRHASQYTPWGFTGKKVSLEHPYAYGGVFDMLMPALAVRRVDTTNLVANYLVKVRDESWVNGEGVFPKRKTFKPKALIAPSNPLDAPKWALYMRYYNKKRVAIADWWSKHKQNKDGQFGGGWNDDTIKLRGMIDLGLDNIVNIHHMIDKVFAGFELTGIYKGGYCRIYPIDRLHTGDFIRGRYQTVMLNLGRAFPAERAMPAAWHLVHPKQTPRYYADGLKSAANVLRWYWGEDVTDSTYNSPPLPVLAKKFRLDASYFNKYYMYRMTKSRVHNRGYTPHGGPRWGKVGNLSAHDIYTYMLGGSGRSRIDSHPANAVTWPEGAGPDVPRVVLHADDTSLKAIVYSFNKKERNLKMQLDRIEHGIYKVGLYAANAEGNITSKDPVWSTEKKLSRFNIVTLPIPPRKTVVVKVKQVKKLPWPSKLADLAVDPWDAIWKQGTVTATIHNIGNKKARDITVDLLDGDKVLQEKTISELNAPTDFIPKKTKVSFAHVPFSRNLRVVVDPESRIAEILETNNTADVVKAGTHHTDPMLWYIHRNKLEKARMYLRNKGGYMVH